jgi:hypothetical protein
VTKDGKTTAIPVSGPPTLRRIAVGDGVARGHLEVRLTPGLQAFSFTYG